MSHSFILVTMIFINEYSREAEKILPEEVKTFIKDIQHTGGHLFVLAIFKRPNENVVVTRYLWMDIKKDYICLFWVSGTWLNPVMVNHLPRQCQNRHKMFGNVGNHMLRHNTMSIEVLLFYFIIIICFRVDVEDKDDETTNLDKKKRLNLLSS